MIKFGILGEDTSDKEALGVLLRRILKEHPKLGRTDIGVESRGDGGCSKLRRKAKAWIRELAASGCTHVILVHDLDLKPNSSEQNDEEALRQKLMAIELPSGVQRLVCIPVEELEAWFWADPKVLAHLAPNARAHAGERKPHTLRKPKERLRRWSFDGGGRPRWSENDNKDLVAKLDLKICADRCSAFRELQDFVVAAALAAPPAGPRRKKARKAS